VVEQWRPDIVHGHNLHHFACEPAEALQELHRRWGFRFHHTFHEVRDDVVQSPHGLFGYEQLYAVSGFVAQACATQLGPSAHVFHLGVDESSFCAAYRVFAAPADQRGVTILHPARLLPWKGVHLSIPMLAQLRDIGLPAPLLITDTLRIMDWHGESATYRADLLALIDALSLHDRVDLRPATYADMPSLYAEADVVVYPTVGEEPYGLVPLEAMSCERPVVVARSGGLSETVLDGNTGLVVPPNNVSALTDAGALLLRSPDDARAMGVSGRRLVKRRFTLDSYGTLLLQRYMGKTVPGI
jgi:glycosyltransferase involved in cell wall biosynthesis